VPVAFTLTCTLWKGKAAGAATVCGATTTAPGAPKEAAAPQQASAPVASTTPHTCAPASAAPAAPSARPEPPPPTRDAEREPARSLAGGARRRAGTGWSRAPP